MANSSYLTKEVESWVRESGLPNLYPTQLFAKQKMKMTWGGEFEVDAVSDKQVICITCAGLGHDGKLKTGPFNKMVKDAVFLLALDDPRDRSIVFIDEFFHSSIVAEQNRGRFPPGINLVLVTLPEEMKSEVLKIREIASAEVGAKK